MSFVFFGFLAGFGKVGALTHSWAHRLETLLPIAVGRIQLPPPAIHRAASANTIVFPFFFPPSVLFFAPRCISKMCKWVAVVSARGLRSLSQHATFHIAGSLYCGDCCISCSIINLRKD